MSFSVSFAIPAKDRARSARGEPGQGWAAAICEFPPAHHRGFAGLPLGPRQSVETLSSALVDLGPVGAILESAHSAVVSMDAQGRIVYWNPQAELLFGVSRER